MRPEDVGFAKTDLVLGKHSGRAALADRAKALGYHLTGEQLQDSVRRVQEAGRQEEGSLRRRHRRADREADDRRRTTCGSSSPTKCMPPARASRRFRSRCGAGEKQVSKTTTGGDGPLDALFRTIEEITGTVVVVPRLPRPQRHARQRRPGRIDDRSRAQRPRLPRPRRVDRHRRGRHAGVPQRRQPRRQGGGQAVSGPRPDMV